jgi:branched-chain amino acid transport system ATP-binding protein
VSTGIMSTGIVEMHGVEKNFGSLKALGPVDLVLHPGERLGLIGPNGSGKTTLINCLSGLFPPDAGTITFLGRDITRLPAYRRARLGIARSFQIPRPFAGMSVIENLLVPMDYLGLGTRQEQERALGVLDEVGLGARRDAPSETLSQLELRKLELARALVCEPKVLVADEAMAGLSEGEIDDVLALLMRLNATGVAIIMIEHIMHAVMRFSQRVICLETGKIIAEGTPQGVAQDKHVQKVYFGERAGA